MNKTKSGGESCIINVTVGQINYKIADLEPWFIHEHNLKTNNSAQA